MRYRIGIDVGGTFTDFVATHGNGLVKGKVPSRPGDESTSVMEAVGEIASRAGVGVRPLLESTDSIVLGTTVVLNTMLEFDGAHTGLITNEGFRDVIELRRGHKESQVDLRLAAPVAIVTRRHRRTVAGRVDHTGRVVEELDEAQVRREAEALREAGVESIAVCFLFSYANPAHEQRAAELIREVHPDCFVTTSSEVLPQIREFERLSTTLVNAYTSPKLRQYLDLLQARLEQEGFGGSLLIMQSNGGVMDVEFSRARGVDAVFSGPSGGVVAGLWAARESGYRNIITADMGGTSYDVCLVHDGEPELGVDQWVSRYRVAVPLLDIHTVGAGGGSIAGVDEGGALHVGPESARAYPGPACYGRGGERPTVTDANLMLGYIDPDRFLSGGMRLDVDAARQAVETHVGAPLGVSATDAAIGIFRIANSDMSNALRYISVSRGRDPRDYALMAFGGAGAIHAAVQASDLGLSTVLVPRHASVLSALGALIADFKVSRVRSMLRAWEDVDLDELNATFLAMQEDAEALLTRGGAPGELIVKRSLDVRYQGQVQEVIVPLRSRTRRVTAVNFARSLRDFHDLHEQLYAFKRPGYATEIVSVRIELWAKREPLQLPTHRFGSEDSEHALVGTRQVYFEPDGFVDARIYDGALIEPGNIITGPAVIHEPDTTIVVAGSQEAMLDQNDMYVIEVSG
ncbi:hydantoinase/oxoprolinase family protein [Capillimicrobium parvum]|uniref:Acetophenone carboxylase gamma subunit n=1 Tax=Capillimicrobium parvum TaxID=2884022 RepID=A0A9E6Y246_9ACTN|nr:hydantoinase/oxoprolinase family protein [Capillimicrobium parvum]UGS38433.1 Acetophenone carboxylase gamma subunit [Capillimicrobium parvum]